MVLAYTESHCCAQNPQWRESLKILKLCVARSSSLEVAPPSAGGSTTVAACLPPGLVSSLLPHTSFAETDVIIKKELPGEVLLIATHSYSQILRATHSYSQILTDTH